jgi:hypothetical protein
LPARLAPRRNTTRAMLRIDPVWDQIRDDPAFKKLLGDKPR